MPDSEIKEPHLTPPPPDFLIKKLTERIDALEKRVEKLENKPMRDPRLDTF